MVEADKKLIERIKLIKSHHPFWGYRRIWAYLNYRENILINKKRVYRLLKENNLLVERNKLLKAKRYTGSIKKPKPTKPNEWWGIDMTKIMLGSFGWIYVVLVLDWHTKKVVGHYAGIQSKAEHWLEALNRAVNRQCLDGSRKHKINLMSDNGCQPTSLSFMKHCKTLEIKQAFTSYNNPKGNADTERMMRTLKEELVWVNEWESPSQFIQALDRWVEEYNNEYLHSALRYQTPINFEKQFGDYTLDVA